MQTLKFIGSGSAFNTKLGNNSAYLKFNNDKEMLLIDCGTTTFQRIKDNNLLEGVEKIHVVITHTHDDHIGSLASLILYTYYSHGEFAKPKVTVYYSDNVEVVKYLTLTGCVLDTHYRNQYVIEGDYYNLKENLEIIFNSTNHVDELISYNIEIEYNDNLIFYSGDSNELSELVSATISQDIYSEIYIDTCKADYEGNVHLSLRELTELISQNHRNRVFCMHLDEGFIREEAENLGFNVVKNEF